jgi:hypothetical protein
VCFPEFSDTIELVLAELFLRGAVGVCMYLETIEQEIIFEERREARFYILEKLDLPAIVGKTGLANKVPDALPVTGSDLIALFGHFRSGLAQVSGLAPPYLADRLFHFLLKLQDSFSHDFRIGGT